MSHFLDFLRRLRGQTGAKPQPETAAAPSGEAPPAPPSFQLIDDIVREGKEVVPAHGYFSHVPVHEFPAWQEIIKLDRAAQADLALETLRRLSQTSKAGRVFSIDFNHRQILKSLLSALLRRRLPFDRERILAFARAAGRFQGHHIWQLPATSVIGAFEDYVGEGQIDDGLRAALGPFAEGIRAMPDVAEKRRLLQRIEKLLEGRKDDTVKSLPAGGEAWADTLLGELKILPPDAVQRWRELFIHLRTATAAKPSEKWLRKTEEIVGRIGQDDFSRIAAPTLSRIGKTGRLVRNHAKGVEDPTLIEEEHADLLRGLVWTAGNRADARLIPALGDAADACFKKVPNFGPRSPKVGNACLYALSHCEDPAAVAQLSRLKSRIRHPSALKQLETALAEAARRQGVTPADLEEMVVPDCGMEEIGIRRQKLDDFTAEIIVVGPAGAELRWLRADGTPQKSVPASVRAAHAEEVKALSRLIKEIEGLLAGQRDRLERLYVTTRDWDLPTWRERYLDHPLVGVLARRLIWRFRQDGKDRLGGWQNGEIVDADGTALADLDDTVRVSLWHPLESPVETVRAWRDWLERSQITQPFKQAYREIYVLTDAEIRTETYSNRFAAHILKQHQFAALCQQRGWRYTLQGVWDSHNTPYRLLPEHDLRVEFWVEGTNDNDVSQNYVFLNISTDQVRFCDLVGAPKPLDQIPPLLFSELMRDVDLFVGVTSIGNDPNWADGNRTGSDYWQQYSFGDLNATAYTRHDVLERLVPRLKIADRCKLIDRFLVVRGDIRTYKIHLGSGNILMDPNDQYLCIVPDRSKPAQSGGKMVLPFEGDSILSLILSKAFLLADDTRITDSTIVSQIRRG
jgi:hypothetical protein